MIDIIEEIKQRLVNDGIASVEADSAMKPHEIEGSLQGFLDCRHIDVSSPKAMEGLLYRRRMETERAYFDSLDKKISLEDYWSMRYREIQVEFVYERLKMYWINDGYGFRSINAPSANLDYGIITEPCRL